VEGRFIAILLFFFVRELVPLSGNVLPVEGVVVYGVLAFAEFGSSFGVCEEGVGTKATEVVDADAWVVKNGALLLLEIEWEVSILAHHFV